MDLLHKLFIAESMELDEAEFDDLDIFEESSKFTSPYFDDFVETGLPGFLLKVGDLNGKSPINNGYKQVGRFYLRHDPIGTFLVGPSFRTSPLLGIERSRGSYTFKTLNSTYKLELLIDD